MDASARIEKARAALIALGADEAELAKFIATPHHPDFKVEVLEASVVRMRSRAWRPDLPTCHA